MATDEGLDLVEISSNGTTPIVKIMDFGKYKKEDWARPGVTGLGIPMDIDYGTRHGVYIHDENGYVACSKRVIA